MKKFVKLFIFAVAAMAFAACSSEKDGPEEGVVWDLAPYEIVINLVDPEGVSLLDESLPGNVVGQELAVKYNDQWYPVEWIMVDGKNDSRAINPHFFGFIATEEYVWDGHEWKINYGKFRLRFGEFAQEENKTISLLFLVPWRNGFDNIELKHHFEWKKHQPYSTNIISLNGKEQEGTEVTVVLPRIIQESAHETSAQ